MFVLALLWMLLLGADKIIQPPAGWNWRKTAAALLLALFVVWAGYFFHVAHLTVRDGTLTATFPNWNAAIVKPVHGSRNYSLLIPAGEYVEGFRELVRHNRQGQPAFFLGQASTHGGWKLYYPVVILLKWPTIVLALSLTGLATAVGRLQKNYKCRLISGSWHHFLCFTWRWRFRPLQPGRPARVAHVSLCDLVGGGAVGMGRSQTLGRDRPDFASGSECG